MKRTLVLLVVLCAMVVPAVLHAQQVSPSALDAVLAGEGYYPAVRVTDSSLQSGAPIRLQVGTFNPTAGEALLIPRELQGNVPSNDEAGHFIVQFRGPVMEEWKEHVVALGASLYDFIPEYAFVAYMNGATRMAVEKMDEVAWTGVFHPAYKLHPSLAASSGELDLMIQTFPSESVDSVAARLAAKGAQILDTSTQPAGGLMRVKGDASLLQQLAQEPSVRWIEPFYQRVIFNDRARGIIAAGTIWNDLGLYGAGQVIAVTDTGLDTGNEDSIAQDFQGTPTGCIGTDRIIATFSLGTTGDWSDSCRCSYLGSWYNEGGHGTHVAGSILGNGCASGSSGAPDYGSSYAGVAPQAGLVFQSVMGHRNDQSCAAPSYGCGLWGLPDDLNDLFSDAQQATASIHSNSWGSAEAGLYTTDSYNTDFYTWLHKDYTILFAAGNPGMDSNRDGVIDDGLVTPPSTAKNCIAVGASENNRPAPCSGNCGYINYPWGVGSWEPDYDTNPVHDDYMSDSSADMAGFSGHGPTADGRVKPDVVAPGTNIISTKSQGTYVSSGWGSAPTPYSSYYVFNGGTSMATPLTSGAVALIRQYYVDALGVDNPSSALLKATLINGATDLYSLQASGTTVWVHAGGDDFTGHDAQGAVVGDLANWGRSGTLWAIATGTACHSSSNHCVRTPATSEIEAVLFTRNLVEIPSTGASLTYYHLFSDNTDGGDIGYVEASTDGGISWTELRRHAAGKPIAWTLDTITLAGATYGGKSVKVRFRMVTNKSNPKTQWTLDDVKIDPVVARSEQASVRPNNAEGWGLINLAGSIQPSGSRVVQYWDNTHGLRVVSGGHEYDQVSFLSSDVSQQYRATAVWTDYPGSMTVARQLVNDLDLQVVGPLGTYYPATAGAEISYDDGGYEVAYRYTGPNTGFAVKFTPISPTTLNKVKYNLNSTHSPFIINIWDDDGTGGLPGTALMPSMLVNPRGSGWVEIDIPDLVIAGGSFYVEMRFASLAATDDPNTDNNPYLSMDCTSADGRSYLYNGTTWSSVANQVCSTVGTNNGDWGIRAIMTGPAADRVNNVEGVDIGSPPNGLYHLRLTAAQVNENESAEVGQPYALIVSGGLAVPSAAESYHYIDPGDDTDEPFGKTGVTMDFASGPGGYVTVAMAKSTPTQPPPSGGSFLNLNWGIDSVMTSFSTQIVFHYDESDLPTGMTESDIQGALRYDDSSSTWGEPQGTVNIADNTVTVDGVSQFSTWTLGHGGVTAVKLTSFAGRPAAGGILVTWETASEHDNAGFNLYRSATVGDIGVRLNDLLIPSDAPGGDQGASYAFLDGAALPGVTYYYTLEDVDLSGHATPHGPVAVTPWWVYMPLVER